MFYIYTDGAASNNGKANSSGGYGFVVLLNNNKLYHIENKFQNNVTNNQMELTAILEAFKFIRKNQIKEPVILYSDSAYCINMLTSWIFTWSQNGWKNSKKEIVANLDLVQELFQYCQDKAFMENISLQKIDGHSNNVGNELADAIASKNRNKFLKFIKQINLQK